MIEGMAAVVQRGIDEILSLRASNKQLLEACEWAYCELENPDCSREDVLEVLANAIRKEEEQS